MIQDAKRYDFIDALRGLAILGILFAHSSQYVAPNNVALQLPMSAGARGVQLFYIVSAWTLCMSWEVRSTHEVFPTRNFFLRRFFRIAPMFYLAILFYVFLYGFSPRYWAPNGIALWFIPLTALFLHGFHPETINSVVPGGWAIAVQMSFYLAFPLLLSRIESIKSCGFVFLLSIIGYVINKLMFTDLLSGYYSASQQYLVYYFSEYNILGQFPVFMMGIFVYLIFKKKKTRKAIRYFAGLLLLFLFLLMMLPGSIALRLLRNPILDGALLAVFALVIAYIPARAIVNRVTTMLGKISFCMYLTHFAVLEFFSRFGVSALFHRGNVSSVLHFLCVVLATALVSFFMYKGIELPGISFGRRLISKLEKGYAPSRAPDLLMTPKSLSIENAQKTEIIETNRLNS